MWCGGGKDRDQFLSCLSFAFFGRFTGREANAVVRLVGKGDHDGLFECFFSLGRKDSGKNITAQLVDGFDKRDLIDDFIAELDEVFEEKMSSEEAETQNENNQKHEADEAREENDDLFGQSVEEVIKH